MKIRDFPYGKYTVIISEGGVSLIDEPWNYTSPNIKPPKDFDDREELNSIAQQVIAEYEEGLRKRKEMAG